jgi:hypothetical protein
MARGQFAACRLEAGDCLEFAGARCDAPTRGRRAAQTKKPQRLLDGMQRKTAVDEFQRAFAFEADGAFVGVRNAACRIAQGVEFIRREPSLCLFRRFLGNARTERGRTAHDIVHRVQIFVGERMAHIVGDVKIDGRLTHARHDDAGHDFGIGRNPHQSLRVDEFSFVRIGRAQH